MIKLMMMKVIEIVINMMIGYGTGQSEKGYAMGNVIIGICWSIFMLVIIIKRMVMMIKAWGKNRNCRNYMLLFLKLYLNK